MRLGPSGGSDPVNNISPELAEAGRKMAERYEAIMLGGSGLWAEMLKKEEIPKKVYFIGTNGNSGRLIADALMESLAYIPAPDGTPYLRRKPGFEYPRIQYYLTDADTQLSEKAPISPVDLFMEDEKAYRALETSILKEFQELETNGKPAAMVVGESALENPENVEIVKTGLVIWSDVNAELSWTKTQQRRRPGGGLYVPFERIRPPVWCIANGWDGDIDDFEAKAEYIDTVTWFCERLVIFDFWPSLRAFWGLYFFISIFSRRVLEGKSKVKKFADKYEEVADIRLRADVPGIQDNQYWGAETLVKAISEFYGLNADGASIEEEMLETDLEKFLEGARLSKYLQAALDWCDEQGAAAIEDVAENADDFADALGLKPLERKRLAKAAEAVKALAWHRKWGKKEMQEVESCKNRPKPWMKPQF